MLLCFFFHLYFSLLYQWCEGVWQDYLFEQITDDGGSVWNDFAILFGASNSWIVK